MGLVRSKSSGSTLQEATGYQGTQDIQTPGTTGTNLNPSTPTPGALTAAMAASFDTPAVYTVSFNLTAASVLPVPTPSIGAPPTVPQPSGSSAGVRCQAVLLFNLEGVTIRRVVDVGSGTSISQVCQGVNVSLQDQTWTVGGPAGVLYSVSVVISKGTRPATELPPVLWQNPFPIIAFTLAPGGTIDVPVPTDAGVTSVEVCAIDTTAPATEPTFLIVSHVTNGTVNKQYQPVVEPGFVKLNPGSTVVNLKNFSGTDIVQCAVTWGIDG